MEEIIHVIPNRAIKPELGLLGSNEILVFRARISENNTKKEFNEFVKINDKF